MKLTKQQMKELLGEIIGQMIVAEFTKDEESYYSLREERIKLEYLLFGEIDDH
jgi:hypothetical protein